MVWRPSGETRFMGWTVQPEPSPKTAFAIGLISNTWMIGVSSRPGSGFASTRSSASSAITHRACVRTGTSRTRRMRREPTSWSGHHAAARRGIASGRPGRSASRGAATAYDPIIGAAQVQSAYNVNGSGMTVAVIDTGIDYNNPALGGGFGPGSKVIAGYDFADKHRQPDGDQLAARHRASRA